MGAPKYLLDMIAEPDAHPGHAITHDWAWGVRMPRRLLEPEICNHCFAVTSFFGGCVAGWKIDRWYGPSFVDSRTGRMLVSAICTECLKSMTPSRSEWSLNSWFESLNIDCHCGHCEHPIWNDEANDDNNNSGPQFTTDPASIHAMEMWCGNCSYAREWGEW